MTAAEVSKIYDYCFTGLATMMLSQIVGQNQPRLLTSVKQNGCHKTGIGRILFTALLTLVSSPLLLT